MACVTNYTVQCKDAVSGETGCFLFDVEHWQHTGEFVAVSPVYASLEELYANTTREQRKSIYVERINK